MSWDATLSRVDGYDLHCVNWNYTHNINKMLLQALNDEQPPDDQFTVPWYMLLDGMNNIEGYHFLDRLLKKLESDPERYKQLDPPNGWGSYDTILSILRDMRDRCFTECLWTWEVTG